MSTTTTKVLGVFQADIIIRTGLISALADIRANPWLLDCVFASIAQDPISRKEYGEKSIQAAKDWFLKTNIPVLMAPVIDEFKLPCITITLADSNEVVSEMTLGDIHSVPHETDDRTWPALCVPFTPAEYIPETGIMTFVEELEIPVFPGQFIIDSKGRSHEILEVHTSTEIKITPDTVADFRGSVIKSASPAWVTSIESASYRETYKIGIHVAAEPVFLTWLHSIVVLALHRYKEILFEARGFERSGFSSADFAYDPQGESELGFTRYITMTGYVRQYWPKAITGRIDGMLFSRLQVIDGGNIPLPESAATSLWVGDDDDE